MMLINKDTQYRAGPGGSPSQKPLRRKWEKTGIRKKKKLGDRGVDTAKKKDQIRSISQSGS